MDNSKLHIIRPSSKNYRQWFIRDPRIIIPFVLLLLTQAWLLGGRNIVFFSGTLIVALGVAILCVVIFFRRARIIVDGQKLSYRGLFFTRSISIENINATFLRINRPLVTVNRSRAVLVIANEKGKKFKRLSEGFWSTNDLEKLAELIGAKSVSLSSEDGQNVALNGGPRLRWIMRHPNLFILIALGGAFVFVVAVVLIVNLVKYLG